MTAARLVLLAAVVAAVVAPGCGDGSRLTHQEFVHEASRICRAASRDLRDTVIPPFHRHRIAARALARLSARERAVLDQLRGLRPPKAASAGVDAWLAVVDQMIDELDFATEALDHGDQGTATAAANRAADLDQRSQDLARARGIAPCHWAEVLLQA